MLLLRVGLSLDRVGKRYTLQNLNDSLLAWEPLSTISFTFVTCFFVHRYLMSTPVARFLLFLRSVRRSRLVPSCISFLMITTDTGTAPVQGS
jgi:hypothetical protein